MNKLHELRVKKGMSRAELAEASGVRQSMISKVENECSKLGPQRLLQVAQGLSVDVSELVDNWNELTLLGQYRLRSGLSQTELANIAGVASCTISMHETDCKQNISRAVAERIATALNVTPKELFGNRITDNYGSLIGSHDKNKPNPTIELNICDECKTVLPIASNECWYCN